MICLFVLSKTYTKSVAQFIKTLCNNEPELKKGVKKACI